MTPSWKQIEGELNRGSGSVWATPPARIMPASEIDQLTGRLEAAMRAMDNQSRRSLLAKLLRRERNKGWKWVRGRK